MDSELAELRLLHLADSALPIGGLAHSFGLETLVAANLVGVRELPEFFATWLQEAGCLEAVFCRAGFRLRDRNDAEFRAEWLRLNEALSARKPGRESRNASASLGRNFLNAISGVGRVGDEEGADTDPTRVRLAIEVSRNARGLMHHSVAFGLAGGVLGFSEERVALAFLHSCMAAMVSACQRLLPLGQHAATRLLWDLKPAIVSAVHRSAECGVDDVASFMAMLDWGAMEHPGLETRLFIS